MSENYQISVTEAPKVRAPPIALVTVHDYQGKDLVMMSGARGPNTIMGNIADISKPYSVNHDGSVVEARFRLSHTGESIARTRAELENIKKGILDPRWLQAGRTLALPGRRLIVNPPKDGDGNYVVNESELEVYIQESEEVDGVWFGSDGFAYVPKFDTGEMSSDRAADNGLVRALEHTKGKANDIPVIGARENHPNEVYVFRVDNVSKPTLRVAGLGSDVDDRLFVDGDGWGGNLSGYAFGVLDKTSEAGSKKSGGNE